MRASPIALAVLTTFAPCGQASGGTQQIDLAAMSIEDLANVDVSASVVRHK